MILRRITNFFKKLTAISNSGRKAEQEKNLYLIQSSDEESRRNTNKIK